MDPRIAQFVVGELKKQTPPEQIMQGLMQNFKMNQQQAGQVLSAIVQELKKGGSNQREQRPEQQEGEDPQRGNDSPEKVLQILDQLQIDPRAAVMLVKEIFSLNQQGLQELLQVLGQAIEEGGQQQKEQGPQRSPEEEGMSEDPMQNI